MATSVETNDTFHFNKNAWEIKEGQAVKLKVIAFD